MEFLECDSGCVCALCDLEGREGWWEEGVAGGLGMEGEREGGEQRRRECERLRGLAGGPSRREGLREGEGGRAGGQERGCWCHEMSGHGK